MPTPSLRVLLGRGDARGTAGGGFQFGGHSYRGGFTQTPNGDVINLVALDEYLYSVVPQEMPSSWPAMALQLQAICSRTFVLRRLDPGKPYDILPSTADQVYEGTATETPAGRAAVDATSGLVLAYSGQYAKVEYSSCCGGHTESSADAWGGEPIPYLMGVVCPYCTLSPDYRWASSIPFAVIERATAPRLRGARLESVRLAARDSSGRARSFTLVTSRGSVSIAANDLRRALGPRYMRSGLIFSLDAAQDIARLQGGGSGHGVGLCQWGARGIALLSGSLAGAANFYFPGTQIAPWTSVSSQLTTTSSRRS